MLEFIENDVWRLGVSPSVGASIASLDLNLAGTWQPVLRETPTEAIKAGKPSPFASFTLAPFSNRIKQAKFSFLGQEYQLKASSADGNTQHGDVRGRPWNLAFKTAKQLDFDIDTRVFSDFNFPFPFTMSVRYELQEDIFVTSFVLTNVGDKHMPAGFGIHPYFNRSLAGSSEAVLAFKADALYEVDEQTVPTGALVKPSAEYDFSTPRPVTDTSLNHLYRDWQELSLTWPEKASLAIYADPIFRHLIAFTHDDGSLALEPVSNATDGFNLMAKGFDGHGVKVLAPNESLQGAIFFKAKLLT